MMPHHQVLPTASLGDLELGQRLVPPLHPLGCPSVDVVRIPRDYHATWVLSLLGASDEPTGLAEALAYDLLSDRLKSLGWPNHMNDHHFLL